MAYVVAGFRAGRAFLIGLMGAIVIGLLLLIPDLYRLLPGRMRWYWPEELALALISAYGATWWLARSESGAWRLAARAQDWLARLDAVGDYAWRKGLALIVGMVCAGFLATWIPHYLTWPWSRDEDTFALLAQSWDRGILPYRDIRAYNFPGETYLFWMLGKAFGWGHTVPFYALDASCVVVLGLVLVGWSRRRLGGAVAGLIGYLAFLKFYLSIAFETAGERDWHTAFLVCLGLLVPQAWPGRWSRIASALATALALSIRPHAVLFLPALASAVAEPRTSSGPGWRGRARDLLEWSLWLGVFLVAVLAPLVVAGILDDLIRGLRVATYGGPYSKVTPSSALGAFLRQFLEWRTDVPLAATLLLAMNPGGKWGTIARTWSLAWLGALIYRTIHPVQHMYLIHPVLLVGSITWALPISFLLSVRLMARPVGVVAVALLAYEIVPSPPWMCDPIESAEAVRVLAVGGVPPDTPCGCAQPYHGGDTPSRWENYCNLLTYLRTATNPETYVANVLNRYPYDSLNGPTGRLSPFRAESGICWLSWVDIDLDPEFARDLERADDSVVVWEPAQDDVDPRMRLERVVAVIRQYFEPEARFGRIEVWRRTSPARK